MLLRPQHRREWSDLRLPEAVVEGQVRQPLPEPLQHRHRHDRGAVERLAQRGQVPGGELVRIGQWHPDGRGQEQRAGPLGLDEPQDLRHVRPGHQPVGGPDGQVGQQEHVHAGRVVERHAVQRVVGLGQVQRVHRGDVLVHQRAVGHHRALGLGRGAGRVEQLHQIGVGDVHVDRRHRPVPPRGEHRVAVAVQGAHPLQPGLAAHRLDPVPQRRVDQRDPTAGLGQQVGQLAAGERMVDRHVHQPGPGTAQERQQVRVGVRADRRHPVAAVEAEREQVRGRPGHRGVQLRVRPGPVGECQRHPVRRAPRAPPHHPVHRARPQVTHQQPPGSRHLADPDGSVADRQVHRSHLRRARRR